MDELEAIEANIAVPVCAPFTHPSSCSLIRTLVVQSDTRRVLLSDLLRERLASPRNSLRPQLYPPPFSLCCLPCPLFRLVFN